MYHSTLGVRVIKKKRREVMMKSKVSREKETFITNTAAKPCMHLH